MNVRESMICDAIRSRRRLEFDYDGRRRVVEPYCHGESTRGVEVLRAVQVAGASRSRGFGFGKLWTVSKMSNVALGDPFAPDDPDYNPDDRGMSAIHCRV